MDRGIDRWINGFMDEFQKKVSNDIWMMYKDCMEWWLEWCIDKHVEFMRITSTWLHVKWLHVYKSNLLHIEQWIEPCIHNMNLMKLNGTVKSKWNSITLNETLNETKTWFISHITTAYWCKWFDTNLLSNF